MSVVDRVKLSDNQKAILLTQVEYRCPKCQTKLLVERKGKQYKRYEIAHIYPHSPLESEKLLLENEERLSDDPESLDNLIPLCNNCHEDFDNPRTVEGYRDMVKRKRQAIRDYAIKGIYSSPIEEDIIQVIHSLGELNDEDVAKLRFTALSIEEKLKTCDDTMFIRKIKDNVTQYYVIVRNEFASVDKMTSGQFGAIAGQVRTFYMKAKQQETRHEAIFNHLVRWISDKTGNDCIAAIEIIVSFFIQNCEVFSDATE